MDAGVNCSVFDLATIISEIQGRTGLNAADKMIRDAQIG